MKKKSIALIATTVICTTLALVLSACGEKKIPDINTGGGSRSSAMSTKDLVAFSAASTATMLDGINSASPASPATVQEMATATPAPTTPSITSAKADPTIEQITKINAQLAVLENFIGTNPMTVVDTLSDNPEYKTMLTITTKDMVGVPTVYTIYFNETLIVETDDDDDDDDDKFEIETEQEFRLDGILVVGAETYTLIGEKELEDGEFEMSLKASLGATFDPKNYITFKQEIEADEQEFSYTVVKNGVTVNKFSIEIENERGEQSIKMKNLDTANGINVRFSKHTENGKTFIKAEIVENNIKTSMKVFIDTNENGEIVYRYKFSSGKEVKHNRGNHFGQIKNI